MSKSEIRHAVAKTLLHGDGWPPTLPEFIALGQSDIDFDAAFTRMLRCRPAGDVEYWACREVGYSCRNYLSERDARAKHRKALQKFAKRAKAGTLPVRNLTRIENKRSQIPASALKRPSPEMFRKDSVFARVAALGRRV